jgi:hypothetical protein
MQRSIRSLRPGWKALLVLAAVAAACVFTETLGPISIPIAPGTGILNAGVGLEDGQPADIVFTVPDGVSVTQVLLYWSHETILGVGDDTIRVNGIDVTGDLIGGPAYFFDFRGDPVDVYGFRADISALGLVTPGLNTLTIDGLDTQVSTPGTGAHGAGVFVIYDDGGPLADIEIFEGVDLAFCSFPEPRGSTVPQTFSFAPESQDRVGDLLLFVGSVSPDRGSEIPVAFDVGAPYSIFDAITADEGRLFDSVALALDIPAGASQLTTSVQSANAAGTCPGSPLNQSVTWLAAAFSAPGIPEEGCTPGYWKQDHHLDSWVGYAPTDDYETVFGVDAPFTLDLQDTMWLEGGQEEALGRHSVAALLNAVHPDVDYAYTEAEVIQLVQDAYASGEIEETKDLFEAANEQFCALD